MRISLRQSRNITFGSIRKYHCCVATISNTAHRIFICLPFEPQTYPTCFFQFKIHPLDRRTDCKEELRKREEFGRVDKFAFMLQTSHHAFGNVLRLLYGERTLANDFALLTFDRFFEETRVGGYRIKASERDVFGKLVAQTLLEALHRKFACAVKRVAGHCELADCRHCDCHLTLLAAEIFDVFWYV